MAKTAIERANRRMILTLGAYGILLTIAETLMIVILFA